MQIKEGSKFMRDVKRMKKRGKNLKKLDEVVTLIAKQEPLEIKHRPHPLTGNWKPFWDCHIEPDWLLIYKVESDTLILYRTGTHSDLFD